MSTQPKERPILFSGPMVQAILEGRKTQTRRVIKESFNGCMTNGGGHPCPNEPVVFHPGEILQHPETGEYMKIDWTDRVTAIFHCSTMDDEAKCPYGKIADVLWVKESFYAYGFWDKRVNPKSQREEWFFEDMTPSSDFSYRYAENPPLRIQKRSLKNIGWYKRPSLFMPRCASRLQLLVNDIKVQALKDISESDAIAEGIDSFRPVPGDGPAETQYRHYLKENKWGPSAIHSYQTLWEKINGPKSWQQDPWVWVIKFERIQ